MQFPPLLLLFLSVMPAVRFSVVSVNASCRLLGGGFGWHAVGWLCLALLGLALPARAEQDLVVQRSYLEDPGGVMSFENVQHTQGWQPFAGSLPLRNKGYPFWVRLRVRAAAAGDWVLRVQPSMLQDIQIFQREPNGTWVMQRLGSHHAYQDRERSELVPSVRYRAPSGEGVVFIRVQSATAVAAFSVISVQESREMDMRTHVLISLYVGFGLVLMCISLLSWWATGQRLWGVSAGFDLATFLLVLLQMGVVGKYLLPYSKNFLSEVILFANSLHTALACVLFFGLLRLFKASIWCTWVYAACILMLPVLWLLIGSGLGAQAMALNNMEVLLLSLWGGVAVWFVPIPDRLLNVLLKTMNTCLAGYLILWLYPVLIPFEGWFNLSLYPAVPSNFFTMVGTLIILARHTQLDIQRRNALESQKQEADLALVYEKQRHAETNSFLSMALHELKTPLSLLRVAVQHLQRNPHTKHEEQTDRLAKMQRAVDNIDAILERCVAVDHLEQGSLAVQLEDIDLTAVLAECVAQTQEAERIRWSSPAAIAIFADGVLLSLMVRNLLDNALRYGDASTPVTLQVRVNDTAVVISVCNAPGRGGWPNPEKLFQKYYRAPSALFCSGTGLGLYWVAQVAQQMQAAVRYVPDPQNVVFELCLKK